VSSPSAHKNERRSSVALEFGLNSFWRTLRTCGCIGAGRGYSNALLECCLRPVDAAMGRPLARYVRASEGSRCVPPVFVVCCPAISLSQSSRRVRVRSVTVSTILTHSSHSAVGSGGPLGPAHFSCVSSWHARCLHGCFGMPVADVARRRNLSVVGNGYCLPSPSLLPSSHATRRPRTVRAPASAGPIAAPASAAN
jgi:hypothetical protein